MFQMKMTPLAALREMEQLGVQRGQEVRASFKASAERFVEE
jgi:hypothetical protein